jgi:hypothetical protein
MALRVQVQRPARQGSPCRAALVAGAVASSITETSRHPARGRRRRRAPWHPCQSLDGPHDTVSIRRPAHRDWCRCPPAPVATCHVTAICFAPANVLQCAAGPIIVTCSPRVGTQAYHPRHARTSAARPRPREELAAGETAQRLRRRPCMRRSSQGGKGGEQSGYIRLRERSASSSGCTTT